MSINNILGLDKIYLSLNICILFIFMIFTIVRDYHLSFLLVVSMIIFNLIKFSFI